jgi:hypothetical protein
VRALNRDIRKLTRPVKFAALRHTFSSMNKKA